MAVYLLNDEIAFPDPREAEPDGLLAVGGDYSVERMLLAYNHGIFPWFRFENEIYWYATNPRLLVFPHKYKPNHGLKRFLKKNPFKITINENFTEVINYCKDVKRKEEGSWINNDYIKSFIELHNLGYAVSIETWLDTELVGGLYGIIAGSGFTGESMFSIKPNASKVAFHYLIMLAKKMKWEFVDAQQETEHLKMLGGELVSFDVFYSVLTDY
jgi:leucyl/phenylalanyl-tRNA--protein transferase